MMPNCPLPPHYQIMYKLQLKFYRMTNINTTYGLVGLQASIKSAKVGDQSCQQNSKTTGFLCLFKIKITQCYKQPVVSNMAKTEAYFYIYLDHFLAQAILCSFLNNINSKFKIILISKCFQMHAFLPLKRRREGPVIIVKHYNLINLFFIYICLYFGYSISLQINFSYIHILLRQRLPNE